MGKANTSLQNHKVRKRNKNKSREFLKEAEKKACRTRCNSIGKFANYCTGIRERAEGV